MKMQTSPNKWSCLPTALAMCLNVPVEKLIKLYGHDGSEKVNELNAPLCYKGFNFEETFLLCYLRFGILLTQVETAFEEMRGDQIYQFRHQDDVDEAIGLLLTNREAIVLGEMNGVPHACAWNKEELYCPTGFRYPLRKMEIESIVLFSWESDVIGALQHSPLLI